MFQCVFIDQFEMMLNVKVPVRVEPANETVSVLKPCRAVTTEYGFPSDFVRKSTASLQIKISTTQHNFLIVT